MPNEFHCKYRNTNHGRYSFAKPKSLKSSFSSPFVTSGRRCLTTPIDDVVDDVYDENVYDDDGEDDDDELVEGVCEIEITPWAN